MLSQNHKKKILKIYKFGNTVTQWRSEVRGEEGDKGLRGFFIPWAPL